MIALIFLHFAKHDYVLTDSVACMDMQVISLCDV